MSNPGATVLMAATDRFWGQRFGHERRIATLLREMSPAEIRVAAAKLLAEMPGPDTWSDFRFDVAFFGQIAGENDCGARYMSARFARLVIAVLQSKPGSQKSWCCRVSSVNPEWMVQCSADAA